MSLLSELTVDRRIPRSRETVFAFLADMTNHASMTDRYLTLECVANDPAEGRVVVKGPLGILRRTASTRVTEASAPDRIAGIATARPGTEARVAWRLAPDGAGTRVVVSVEPVRADARDRVLLAIGGRWWLRWRLRSSLRLLDRALAAEPEKLTASAG